MKKVRNVHQLVWKILDSDMGIKKDLARGVINIRALASYLIKRHQLRASLDSVISSIRRFTDQNDHFDYEKKVGNFFKDITIKTRNNVVCLELKKDAPIREWFNKIKDKGSDARVITGDKVTKILLHNSLVDSADDHFSKNDVLSRNEPLGEIMFTLDKKSVKTKGVLSKISSELAMNEINIEEIIVCPPEFTVYVKNDDLLKSHETLFKLGV